MLVVLSRNNLSCTGAKYAYDIYRAAVKACERDLSVSRYEMPKAALVLLARHGDQLSEYMLDDYEAMYNRYGGWGFDIQKTLVIAILLGSEESY